MNKIDVAIFDIGGVLTSSKYDTTGNDIQRELGVSDERMRQIWDYYIPTFGSGKIDEAEFWTEVANKFGTRLVTPEENLFGRTFDNDLEIHYNLLDYMRGFGEVGVKLAALSDTNIVHANILRAAGVYEPFDRLFLSHETGLRKPAPEIYKHVLQELDVAPGRTIYVDDLPINLEPAADLGMHTILATSPEQVIEDLKETLK